MDVDRYEDPRDASDSDEERLGGKGKGQFVYKAREVNERITVCYLSESQRISLRMHILVDL